jgi:hypothetical protein
MRAMDARRTHASLVADWERYAVVADRTELLAVRRPERSGWSVGEHLEHMARVDLLTIAGLGKVLADAASGSPRRPTLAGRCILRLGWFPRGLGKAPRAALPRAESADGVRAAVAEATAEVAGLAGRLAEISALRIGMRHPYFGVLGGDEWLRTMVIHHRHHEKIIADLRR